AEEAVVDRTAFLEGGASLARRLAVVDPMEDVARVHGGGVGGDHVEAVARGNRPDTARTVRASPSASRPWCASTSALAPQAGTSVSPRVRMSARAPTRASAAATMTPWPSVT